MQEYVPGGDFRTLLNNTGVLHFGHARFYISEMFTSVNSLHELGYIHRDLKPENFLIDSTGHIKLTDFGLSAGKLAPQRMDSIKMKLEQVKDMDIPERSTRERRNAYRTLRENDEHYVSNDPTASACPPTPRDADLKAGQLCRRFARLYGPGGSPR